MTDVKVHRKYVKRESPQIEAGNTIVHYKLSRSPVRLWLIDFFLSPSLSFTIPCSTSTLEASYAPRHIPNL